MCSASHCPSLLPRTPITKCFPKSQLGRLASHQSLVAPHRTSSKEGPGWTADPSRAWNLLKAAASGHLLKEQVLPTMAAGPAKSIKMSG